ncbi:MAG: aminotransferase class I/II-fold pyridoxal phosphate-dependent enzyme [Bacteriovoracaceae bacterium]|nr:aminotransferase class I/II-fold pyridoxal phosphate-dependent enzyme [Bacteriovoracaceae bacterium]
MKKTALRIAHFKDSIFGVMSKLARDNNAVNLGQGFPDFDGPQWLKDLAKDKIEQGHGQYAPFMGTPSLRSSVSSYYKRFYQLDYNPDSEITITAGATEGLFISILGSIDPGDEVIVLEPFYDSYVSSIEMAGGVAVPVTLHAPDFNIIESELMRAITSKTKMIIVNNPHNPSGKVWEKNELEIIVKLAIKHDLFVISDEVYEFLVFDGAKHFPLAQFPGMRERTFTISSAGKTFGLTGWKTGWICAPPDLTKAVRLVHQYVTFSVATPMQEAIADGLNRLEDYLPEFRSTYKAKRDFFFEGLKKLGFEFSIPRGTYFMMVPIKSKTTKNDVEFAMELVQERKLATVPPSAFYLKSKEGQSYLRFCFAKNQSTLEAALKNLEGL